MVMMMMLIMLRGEQQGKVHEGAWRRMEIDGWGRVWQQQVISIVQGVRKGKVAEQKFMFTIRGGRAE